MCPGPEEFKSNETIYLATQNQILMDYFKISEVDIAHCARMVLYVAY